MSQKKHKDTAKNSSTAPLSQEEEALVQEQLTNYQQITTALHTCQTAVQVEEVLTPISQLSESAQMVLLMALSREKTSDAADVLLAINTFSPLKEVRKEARRSLIRMEGFRHYPRWTPPSTAIPAFKPLKIPQTVLPMQEPSPMDEARNLLEQLMEMVHDPEETITEFLGCWLEEDYRGAYACLASTSPLREDLGIDEWVARREAWAELTHPSQGKFEIAYPYEEEDEELDGGDEFEELDDPIVVSSVPEEEMILDEEDEEDEFEEDDEVAAGPDEFEAFWSLTLTNAETAGTLPELPQATAIYKATGRHWFWTRYTLVYEEDEWRILTMVDSGTEALQLSEEVLQEKMAAIVEMAAEQLALVEEMDSEEDEEDEDESEYEEEDDEDDDGDEDEDEDEELSELVEHFEEIMLITTRAMHYVDALIKQSSTDAELYSLAYDQAITIQENERAAAYIEMQAERFPEMRGEALRKLAIAQLNIAALAEENEEEEQSASFVTEAEKNLRISVAADGAAMGYILLAETLIAQEKQLEEAEQLLQLVLTQPEIDDKEATLAESGMGRVAERRGDKERALHHYERAASIRPDLPGIWFTIGSIQRHLGQLKEAEQSYLRGTQEAPNETSAYVELSALYTDRKDLDAAEAILEEGLEINPEEADLLAAMALVYVNKGNMRLAKEYLDEAEEIDENLDIVQVVRGHYDAKLAERQQHKQKQKSRKFKKK